MHEFPFFFGSDNRNRLVQHVCSYLNLGMQGYLETTFKPIMHPISRKTNKSLQKSAGSL
jgi:hypothetical protein